MHKLLKSVLIPIAAAAALIATGTARAADDYPTKPIRMVVPGPAGGPTDLMARDLAAKLSEFLPQPIVIFNQAGAGGMIAAGAVAKAAPDGYTVLFGNQGPLAANYALYDKVPYNVQTDFAPVSRWAVIPNVLLVNAKVPVNTVQELVALVRKGDRAWSFASGGNGTSTHIAGAVFAKRANLKMTHVPYKGAPPSLQDLMGGQIPVAFSGTVDSLALIRAGSVKALAVTSLQRVPSLPNVPTVAETVIPGYSVAPWFGVVAPAGTPPDVIEKLNAAIAKAGRSPDLVKKIQDLGGAIATSSSAEFGELMKKDVEHWATLINESGAKVD
ncbi:Bug family tripartite tricarboxylate transporter substrate binding protein [Ramlibacter albus]|uniref:Tripartite tricarboxylate transporter substrate binding protein n=1 Tax=Ramlibacter albus TaxID=2079448 RepID=A0A923MCL0_9BURK|nr:tripartite tricarboxylate transporter substrate-binding protein [Ramlibacter albus]MBC5767066.1 tripartite tricarboxylate transporter substrate binding protein [Ramlibacter albus]